MGLIVILIITISILPIIFFIFGRKAAKDPNNIIRRYPVIAKVFIWGYVIFAGCFVYPVRSEPYPLDFNKLYLLLVSYGIIGLGLAATYGEKKERRLYPMALLLTIVGMCCRYFMEYGETSNTYNFTMFNIVSYAVIMPVYTVGAYYFIGRYLKERR